MAKRPFIFRGGSTELVLPVTPDSYTVSKGVNVETINIHELGDVVLLGYGTLATIQVNCLFPANSYAFAQDSSPDSYVDQFRRWIDTGRKLRFIVGNTGVNIPVVIENMDYGERDGTNDLYARITLREYRNLQAAELSDEAWSGSGREPDTKTSGDTASSYQIQQGDTLSAICRRYYGDSSSAAYRRLAEYNGIANPHLIYAGNTIQIPQPLP